MKYLLSLILSCVASCHLLYAQHAVVVPNSKYNIDYQKHVGYIVLNNGKKVEGVFKYDSWEFPSFNLRLYDKNDKKIGKYLLSQIKSAVFYGSDTSLTAKDSTFFTKLNSSDKSLYRQLTFGDIAVFDNLFNVNERIGLVKEELVIRYRGNEYTTHSDKEFIETLQKLLPKLSKFKGTINRQSAIKKMNS